MRVIKPHAERGRRHPHPLSLGLRRGTLLGNLYEREESSGGLSTLSRAA